MFSPSSSILEFSLTFYCLARALLPLVLGWWSCYRGSLPHLLLAAPRIAIKQQLANIYIILCNTAHSNTAPRHGTLTATAFSFTFTLTILHCWQRIVLTSRKLNLSAIFSGDAWSLLKCPLHYIEFWKQPISSVVYPAHISHNVWELVLHIFGGMLFYLG